MRVRQVASTDLFTGSELRPLQIIRVSLDGGPAAVRVEGPGVTTPEPVTAAPDAEVPVAISHGPGPTRRVTVIAESAGDRAETSADITVAEPGWTMWMVSHFHYDPVWWNTQGAFTESWELGLDSPGEQRTAFELVRRHLDAARHDPDYKFVLAEIDYLKPHWDAHPEDRADLRAFLADGRVEIVGGNYNEPNTNLTCTESTIRNAALGVAYQRDVVGGDPRSAWMLDVFGHDPAYPGLMAGAGLTSSAWARGPFHQWGPDDNTDMQFPSEFEWISPGGRGLLTAYMANHYGAGWAIERYATVEEAMQAAYAQFQELKPVAASRNVLLPVGGDHVVPSRWCTAIHREWNKRYLWPRFVVALPRDFFAAVRSSGVRLTPQTRDMNPVYPGKDVSYIDTKQAQRAAETAVLDGERLATLTALLGHPYPGATLDKAWRQLCFGAHHDGITGSESDQVYLDLLGGWREAYELGDRVRAEAARRIAARADTRCEAGGRPIVVVNTLARARDAIARVRLRFAPGEAEGVTIPGVRARAEGVLRHDDGSLAEATLTFLANDVPALGHRVFHAFPGTLDEATPVAGPVIENDAYRVAADGAALSSIVDRRTGRELLRPGAFGNELYLQEEYDNHPDYKEGPWLLLPKGPGRGSAGTPAEVRAEESPAGQHLTIAYELGGLRVTQVVDCWRGLERVDFRTHVDGSIGHDRLLRVRFGFDAPGALPVHEVGNAAIGRAFGVPDADAARFPFTLDNPAYTWCALSATARAGDTAIGVAEVIADEPVRGLMVALANQGVTATCARPDGPRAGANALDSGLPDVRIVVGENAFAARVLESAGPAYAETLRTTGRVWVPARRSRADAYRAGTDLRGPRDLPVLIVIDSRALARDLADGVIEVDSGGSEPWCGHTVALLNRGTPGCVAEPDGTLHLNLMRSCSGWPAGVWIDGERRTTPDGASFQWQHWSHTFEYALAADAGDWREAGLVRAGQSYNHDLIVVEAEAHDGDLADATSLFSVEADEPDGEVVLTALKPQGSAPAPDRLTVRCYEAHGRPVRARVRGATGLTGAEATDHLEERPTGRPAPAADGESVVVDLSPAETVTLSIVPGERLDKVRSPQAAVEGEPAQPVATRYWLHGKGAAPVGDLPVAVHLSPAELAGSGTLRVTVAAGPRPTSGRVRLDVPPGLTTPARDLAYDLGPGEHRAFEVPVTVAEAADGAYFVAARIRDALGQTLEDTACVTVGPPIAYEILGAEPQTRAVRLPPGGRGQIALRLHNRARGPVRGEAQLLSPYGTWAALSPWTQGFSVRGGESARLVYDVRMPATARRGTGWWAVVKVMWFGRLHYTEAIAVEVPQTPELGA